MLCVCVCVCYVRCVCHAGLSGPINYPGCGPQLVSVDVLQRSDNQGHNQGRVGWYQSQEVGTGCGSNVCLKRTWMFLV